MLPGCAGRDAPDWWCRFRSFDDLAAKLREPELLDVMQKTVLRVFYLSFGRRGTRRIAEANLNIRVFLAAYMIAFRPSYVFEQPHGALEKELHAVSEPLLQYFERVCEELREKPIHNVARELTDEFPAMLHTYVKKFKAWKIPDETKLSERIKHALAALYQVSPPASICRSSPCVAPSPSFPAPLLIPGPWD